MGDSDITDRAFSGASPHGLVDEDTSAGALSFLRRPYSKDARGADVVVSGAPPRHHAQGLASAPAPSAPPRPSSPGPAAPGAGPSTRPSGCASSTGAT